MIWSPARPHHALARRHVPHPLVDELLHPFSFVSLRGVDVALGIGRYAVHAVKLARLASAIAEVRYLFQRLAKDDPYFFVLAVGKKNEALLGIPGKRYIPRRPGAESFLRIERFFHERPVRAEDLDAIGLAVAHIDETVVRAFDAMHGVAKLLRRRRFRVVVAEVPVVGLVPICAPVAFHLSGIGVDHRDAFVLVAVGYVRLVGLGIDPDLRNPSEILLVVAAGILPMAAQLHEELPVFRKFQDVGIALAVAAEPDVALIVNVYAVRANRPFVAFARTAPVSHQIARLIVYQYGRSGATAFGYGRIQ